MADLAESSSSSSSEQQPQLLQPQRSRGPPARLLPKLASLIIRHADFVGVTSCISGLVALLLLPALAKTTYISENALIPGSASPKFSNQDAMDAVQLVRELLALNHNGIDGLMAVRRFLVGRLVEMGAEFYLHPFSPPESSFSSVHFFSTSSHIVRNEYNFSSPNYFDNPGTIGVNIVGIVRAPQGEGNEAIVLVTPFEAVNLAKGDALSLGIGLTLFGLFSKAPWLAKDIIWLAADSHHGDHAAVAAWLKDYHDPAFHNLPNLWDSSVITELYGQMFEGNATAMMLEDITVEDFKRAGVIAAGIVLKVHGGGSKVGDSLKVYAEGSNGQMPNLDLINVVNNLAVWRQGLHMHLDTVDGMLEWVWLHFVGQVIEKVGQVAAILNPGWKFGLPVSEYVHGAATLTSSLFQQALGIPTGAHGAFRDYQLDALTVIMSPSLDLHGGHVASLRKLGRLLEGVIRSVNNLLEKFHQSFFLYFLTAPNKFISVGVYMIPLLLFIVTLPLKAAALCSHSNGSDLKPNQDTSPVSDSKAGNRLEAILPDMKLKWSFSDSTLNFGRWASAVFTVCLFELWSLLVAMFPPFASSMAGTSEFKAVLWICFAVISFLLMLVCLSLLVTNSKVSKKLDSSAIRGSSWTAVKASTLGAATIGLGIMSAINFAAALVGAVLLVPMCLIAFPLRLLHKRKGFTSKFASVLGLAFTLLVSLPALIIFAMIYLADSPKLSLTILWDWTERMWCWGSATYLYLFLVHLPCSILCLYLLLFKDV